MNVILSQCQMQLLLRIVRKSPTSEEIAHYPLLTFYSLVDRGYVRPNKKTSIWTWDVTVAGQGVLGSFMSTNTPQVKRKVTPQVITKVKHHRRFRRVAVA